MNKENEVMHALGHHTWVYLCWHPSRHKAANVGENWEASLNGRRKPKLNSGENWPVRACPVCGMIEEYRFHGSNFKQWGVSNTYLRAEGYNDSIEWVDEIHAISKQYLEKTI